MVPAWATRSACWDACSYLVPVDQPVCAVEIADGRTSERQLLPHCCCYWKGEFLHVCSQWFVDVQLDAPGYTVGVISAHKFEKAENLEHIHDAVMLLCWCWCSPVGAGVFPGVRGLHWEEPQLLVALQDALLVLIGCRLAPVALRNGELCRGGGDFPYLQHSGEHGEGEDHRLTFHSEEFHL